MTEALSPAGAAAIARAIKARRPVVHCLTNLVTIDWVARGLAAAGASPIMAFDRCEVAAVAAHADALVLNLGTWRPENLEAMLLAGEAAAAKGIPIVLDPVGVGAAGARVEAARRLLAELPVSAVRGNAAEIAALVGSHGELRGIEAAGAADPAAAATAVAARWRTLVVCTGATDRIATAERAAAGAGAHPLLASVVGAGCLLTALLGAALAVQPDDPFATAAATLAWHGACARQAAAAAAGPGSFTAAYLDALHAPPSQ